MEQKFKLLCHELYKQYKKKKQDVLRQEKKNIVPKPGLAKTKTRSMSGFREAIARARHPPKDSPTRYTGVWGLREFSDLTVSSTSFTRSRNATVHSGDKIGDNNTRLSKKT